MGHSETCTCWIWDQEVADYAYNCGWPGVGWQSYWGTSDGGTNKWVCSELWYCGL